METEKINSENTSSKKEENPNQVLFQEYKIGNQTIKLYNTSCPQRLEVETYEEYRIRRQFNNAVNKQKLKPKLYWNSSKLGEATPENIKRQVERLLKEQEK